MKVFSTLEELHAEWEINGACKEGKEFNHSCNSLQEIFEKCPLNFRVWRISKGYTQFAEHCPWNQLKSCDWVYLLLKRPEFTQYCDWKKLEVNNWNVLLYYAPEFVKYCKKNLLAKLDWEYILSRKDEVEEVYNQIKAKNV